MAGLFGAHRRLLFVWKPSDGVAAGKGGLMAGGLERLSISLRMLAISRIEVYVDSWYRGLLDRDHGSGISFAWEYSQTDVFVNRSYGWESRIASMLTVFESLTDLLSPRQAVWFLPL